MDILDNTFETEDRDSPQFKRLESRLRQQYSVAKQSINNSRKAIGLVTLFTLISLLFMMRSGISGLEVTSILIVALIFGICAAVVPKYAKYSLSIALALYLLNTIASLFQASDLWIFSLLIKGIIIYFIIVGLGAALKLPKLLEQMERHNITPYRD